MVRKEKNLTVPSPRHNYKKYMTSVSKFSTGNKLDIKTEIKKSGLTQPHLVMWSSRVVVFLQHPLRCRYRVRCVNVEVGSIPHVFLESLYRGSVHSVDKHKFR